MPRYISANEHAKKKRFELFGWIALQRERAKERENENKRKVQKAGKQETGERK